MVYVNQRALLKAGLVPHLLSVRDIGAKEKWDKDLQLKVFVVGLRQITCGLEGETLKE